MLKIMLTVNTLSVTDASKRILVFVGVVCPKLLNELIFAGGWVELYIFTLMVIILISDAVSADSIDVLKTSHNNILVGSYEGSEYYEEVRSCKFLILELVYY